MLAKYFAQLQPWQLGYNPDQPRDEIGRFGEGGGASIKVEATNIGGSTGAKVVSMGESKYVMKQYSGREEQAKNEYVANQLYKEFGSNAGAPDSELHDYEGKTAVLNPYVEKITLGNDVSDKASFNEKVSENFVADAWLANWDVVGMGADNIAESAGGGVHRLDNGGALLYRAQGGLKGDAFGPKVGELSTFRDSGMNRDAARVFKSVDNKAIVSQVKELSAKYNKETVSRIVHSAKLDKATSDKLINTLDARMQYLREHASGLKLANEPNMTSKRAKDGTFHGTSTGAGARMGASHPSVRKILASKPKNARAAHAAALKAYWFDKEARADFDTQRIFAAAVEKAYNDDNAYPLPLALALEPYFGRVLRLWEGRTLPLYLGYNPDQPRDEAGKFGEGGGGASEYKDGGGGGKYSSDKEFLDKLAGNPNKTINSFVVKDASKELVDRLHKDGLIVKGPGGVYYTSPKGDHARGALTHAKPGDSPKTTALREKLAGIKERTARTETKLKETKAKTESMTKELKAQAMQNTFRQYHSKINIANKIADAAERTLARQDRKADKV